MASLHILPTLTAGRRLRLIPKLQPPLLIAAELLFGFLQLYINCNALPMTLFFPILDAFIVLTDGANVKMERALLKNLIFHAGYWQLIMMRKGGERKGSCEVEVLKAASEDQSNFCKLH